MPIIQAPACVRAQSDCAAHDYRVHTLLGAVSSRTPSTQMLTMHFAVRQLNLEQLSATLDAVSDPRSPRYGQYLTRAEVQAAHTDFEAAAAVERFVQPFVSECMSGNATVDNSGDFVSVTLSARAAERMLATQVCGRHVFHANSFWECSVL